MALYSFRDPGFRWSVIALAILTAGSVLVGFVLLPSVHGDFSARGLWDAICRAAGVPASWSAPKDGTAAPRETLVVLERSMTKVAPSDAVGRGGTLALNCTMCHGAQGMSASNAPNLAGQYPEVVIKQMHDYKSGRRSSTIMEALARALNDDQIRDIAAYYAYLPKARTAPTTYDENLPALVRVGDPLRNIAPCISCHGGVDQKIGTPWIEGMPKAYLVAQLRAFKSGERRNDAQAQMRNMVRGMTEQEIDEVATFYARKASTGENH
ncbi:c-type cytochrome [Piscinibacter gummiphilus]|uniref:Cytochrome C n=1 Tax=Piscinibacter gummiphilus TaxID=946333 RepID=A0A1W6L2I3_9BURK|nr:c-type cytochrome [Piscinibacter gummiphilus]ARN18474.1 cytochrome C [Piscinibacter gummiphilus]ATU63099.1 cytochrome c4 [Piscinibacter gummiphilus]GLS95412.1 cytochrome c [Piscinibacter gummiphilus]